MSVKPSTMCLYIDCLYLFANTTHAKVHSVPYTVTSNTSETTVFLECIWYLFHHLFFTGSLCPLRLYNLSLLLADFYLSLCLLLLHNISLLLLTFHFLCPLLSHNLSLLLQIFTSLCPLHFINLSLITDFYLSISITLV